MTKVKVNKTRKFHSVGAWIVRDGRGNYVTSVEFLRDTPKSITKAYFSKVTFSSIYSGEICVFTDYLEACAVAN